MDFDGVKPIPYRGPNPEDHKLDLDLLENGIDFIRAGTEHFVDNDNPKMLKYALLHFFAGTLLIFKERLRREHPSLIFVDPGDAVTETDKPAEEHPTTINFDQTLKRLKACANITLDPKQEKLLRNVQRLRNRLEHYKFELNLKHAQSLTGGLAEFVCIFLRDELGTNLEDHIDAWHWRELLNLRAIADRIEKERLEDWRSRARGYMDLDDAEIQRRLDEIEPYHPRHNPDPVELLECPECGEDGVLIFDSDRDIGLCTRCKEVHYVGECLRCNGVLYGDEEGFCSDCLSFIDSQ